MERIYEKIYEKILVFVISILSISIVVFNNLTQLTDKIFNPRFNVRIFISFGLATIGVVSYIFINRKFLR